MRNSISNTLSDLELTRFLIAITLILLFSHVFGHLFHRFKLPRVIGEILGGILLGPTALGYFMPEVYAWIFAAFETEGKLISLISYLGLIFLMFISGFEIQKTLDREEKKNILVLAFGSFFVPFTAGLIAPFIYNFQPYIGEKNNVLALQLVIAIATSVTSVPVISKIFIDLEIINTRFAKIVLSIAIIHDIVLWIVLAIVTGLVNSKKISILSITNTVLATILFLGITLLIIPKLLNFLNYSKWNFLLTSSKGGYILFICFFFSAIASFLSVNIIFGSLLSGILIGVMPPKLFEKEKKYIKDISLSFFIPVYFGIVGLKLNLIYHFDLLFTSFFILFTTIFPVIGTVISAKILRKDWLTSINLSIAVTTKGGPGIVLATIAYDLGIVNETFFVTLVLTAIVTSLLAGVWFRYVLAKGLILLR